MTYSPIRSKDGELRVSVDAGYIAYILTHISGKWVEKNFKSGKRMVYVFSKNDTICRTFCGKETGVLINVFVDDYIDINGG